MKIRSLVLTSLISIFPAILFGQGTSTSFSELTSPPTAQSAALASSNFTGSSLDASYLNPAVLGTLKTPSLLISTSRWIQETSTYTASIAFPIKKGTISATVWTLSVPDIEVRTNPGEPEGFFSYRSTFFSASYALTVFDNISIGITGKYLFNKIYVDELDGFAVDGGLIYGTEKWNLGFSLRNLGSVKEQNRDNELPTTISIGGNYNIPIWKFESTVFLGLSSETRIEKNHLHLGLESIYDDVIIARIGYVSGYDSHGISFGGGIKYSLLQIDYAYVPFSYSLGNSHFVSIRFGLK